MNIAVPVLHNFAKLYVIDILPAGSDQFFHHCLYTELMKHVAHRFAEIIERFLAMQQKLVT